MCTTFGQVHYSFAVNLRQQFLDERKEFQLIPQNPKEVLWHYPQKVGASLSIATFTRENLLHCPVTLPWIFSHSTPLFCVDFTLNCTIHAKALWSAPHFLQNHLDAAKEPIYNGAVCGIGMSGLHFGKIT